MPLSVRRKARISLRTLFGSRGARPRVCCSLTIASLLMLRRLSAALFFRLAYNPSGTFFKVMVAIAEIPKWNHIGILPRSPQEEEEWERYQYLEHLVRIAKAKACLKLGIGTVADG